MNSRSIGSVGGFVVLIVPFLGFHLFNLIVGLDQLDHHCNEPFVPMPYWLIGNSVQGLSFFLFGVMLLGLVYWTRNRILSWLFSGVILLNLLFQIGWSIVGMSSLFTHTERCLDQSELLWIVVLATVILQWVSIIMTVIFKIIKECCVILEPVEPRGVKTTSSIFDA